MSRFFVPTKAKSLSHVTWNILEGSRIANGPITHQTHIIGPACLTNPLSLTSQSRHHHAIHSKDEVILGKHES